MGPPVRMGSHDAGPHTPRSTKWRERKMRVRREPFAAASGEDDGAAAGTTEVGAVGTQSSRVPRGGDPRVVAHDPTARVGHVDREALDVGPDVLTFRFHDVVDAGDERPARAERGHVWRAGL